MSSYDSQPGKTPGNDSVEYRADDKPATITVETVSGETQQYDVEHHLRSDNGWVSMWLTRDGGIDVQVPRERGISIERGRELGADGGHVNITACTCGSDLVETAELGTEIAPAEGARLPRPETVEIPAATCSECGEDVGVFGTEVVMELWEARGESLPGHGDGNEVGGR